MSSTPSGRWPPRPCCATASSGRSTPTSTRPIIERAAGGSVVTGFGGDELGNSLGAARAERILSTRRLRRTGATCWWWDWPPRRRRCGPPSIDAGPGARCRQVTWLTEEGIAAAHPGLRGDRRGHPARMGGEAPAVDLARPVLPHVRRELLGARLVSRRRRRAPLRRAPGARCPGLGWRVRRSGRPHRAHAPGLRRPASRRADRAADQGGVHRSAVDRDGACVRPRSGPGRAWTGCWSTPMPSGGTGPATTRHLVSTTLLQAAWLHDHGHPVTVAPA